MFLSFYIAFNINFMFKHRFPCYSKRSEYVDGDGLFCKVDIPPHTIFIVMDGDFITDEEYTLRFELGKGGYAHRIRKNTVLDCYDKCNQGLCLGSKSNSALHLFHRTTMEPAKNNATNTYDPKTKVMSLKSLSLSIPAHTEIFYPYGSSYKLEYFV